MEEPVVKELGLSLAPSQFLQNNKPSAVVADGNCSTFIHRKLCGRSSTQLHCLGIVTAGTGTGSQACFYTELGIKERHYRGWHMLHVTCSERWHYPLSPKLCRTKKLLMNSMGPKMQCAEPKDAPTHCQKYHCTMLQCPGLAIGHRE